jgi:hypothetical protein
MTIDALQLHHRTHTARRNKQQCINDVLNEFVTIPIDERTKMANVLHSLSASMFYNNVSADQSEVANLLGNWLKRHHVELPAALADTAAAAPPPPPPAPD